MASTCAAAVSSLSARALSRQKRSASRSVVAVASTGMLLMIAASLLDSVSSFQNPPRTSASGRLRFNRRTRKRAWALLSRTSSAETQIEPDGFEIVTAQISVLERLRIDDGGADAEFFKQSR